MLRKANTEQKTAARDAAAAALSLSRRLKEVSKQIIARGLYHSGLMRGIERLARTHELRAPAGSRLPRLQRHHTSKFGILCYHRVGTEGVPLFSRLDPNVFEAQMRYLRKHHRIVSLGQLCRELQEGEPVEPAVSVTFDDGYRDLYTHAFPVLQRYQIPATIYLIGQCVETGEVPWYDRIFLGMKVAPGPSLELDLDGPRLFDLSTLEARAKAAWEIVCYLRTIPDSRRRKWCVGFEQEFRIVRDALTGRMLNLEQIQTMQRGGLFFGAHTMTHPVVSQLGPEELVEELGESKHYLEVVLDAPVQDFAYPFGKDADRSSAAENFLVQLGFRSAVTTTEGVNSTNANLLALCRLQIGNERSLPLFALHMARMFLEPAAKPRLVSSMAELDKMLEARFRERVS